MAEQALFDAYPEGFPRVLVAGSVINLRFFVPGKAVAAGRPRSRVQKRAGGTPYAQIYMPKETLDYEDRVAQHARSQLLGLEVEGEGDRDFLLPIVAARVVVSLRINKLKPVSYPARVVHDVFKPDGDNLAKSVFDGVVKGAIIKDDCLITDHSVAKRFAAPGHPEGVEIDITAIPTEVP